MSEPTAESWREKKKQMTRDALHSAARRRVIESGLVAVTIDEICAEVGVSPRTFFNYFPSKAAAAAGLPDLQITDEQRQRYLDARGNPVHDLCLLAAEVIAGAGTAVSDKSAIHDLISARPELHPEVFAWLHDVRKRFFEVAQQRLPVSSAKFAVALLMTSLGDAMEAPLETDGTTADRLWRRILDMCALVTQPAAQPALV